MPHSSSEEKRRIGRVEARLSVQYVLHMQDGQRKWDLTTTQNISERGLNILTSRKFDRQVRIVLRIKLPSHREMLDMTGIVIDSTPRGISFLTRIEFRDIAPENRRALRAFLQEAVIDRGQQ